MQSYLEIKINGHTLQVDIMHSEMFKLTYEQQCKAIALAKHLNFIDEIKYLHLMIDESLILKIKNDFYSKQYELASQRKITMDDIINHYCNFFNQEVHLKELELI